MTFLQTNRSLLKRFRQGAQQALAEVYRAYVNQVLRLLSNGFTEKRTGSFVNGIQDVDLRMDCLQEVFIKAFAEKARNSYDGLRPYSAYLTTIARYHLIDVWRSRSRDPLSNQLLEFDDATKEASMETQLGHNSDQSTDTEEERLHWQKCLEVSDAYVASLDELSMRFVKLRFQEEMPQLDVAQTLGISRWKVRSLEKRMQSNVMKNLQRKGLA